MKKMACFIMGLALLTLPLINISGVSAEEGDYFSIEVIAGSFNGAEDVALANGSLIIADSLNNSIKKIELAEKTTTEIVAQGANEGQVSLPHAVHTSQDGGFSVSDDLRIQIFNTDNTLAQSYRDFYHNNSPKNMGCIINFEVTLDGDYYLLDSERDLVLLKTHTDTRFNQLCDLSDFGFAASDSSKIAITLDKHLIFISNATRILVLDATAQLSTTTIDISSLGAIADISVDYNDNLYILHNDILGDTSLTRFAKSSDVYLPIANFDFSQLPISEAKALTVDFENGCAYITDASSVYLASGKLSGLSFFNTFLDLAPPVNYADATVLSSKARFAVTLTEGVGLLSYPNNYNYALIATLPINTKMILLVEESLVAPDFCYVLNVTLQGNNVAGYIKKSEVSFETDITTAEIDWGRTILNNTKIYKYPTALLSPDSELILGTLSARVDVEILTVASSINDYLGYSFYCIPYQGGFAYIKQSAVRNSSVAVPEPAFIPNAKLVGSYDIVVYTAEDKSSTLTTLAPETKVKLIAKDNYTAKIEFLVGDVVTVGYIDAGCLSDGSLSVVQILGIVLGVVGVGLLICFSVFTIKYYGKSKKKRVT